MFAPGTRITVFGGSGFIGRYLVQRLAAERVVVRVAGRDPAKAALLKPAGMVGQIVPVRADVTASDAVLAAAVAGAEAVVNLVGILHEGGRQRFQAVHADGPARLARIAALAGVKRFVHVSAIGADVKSPSAYARTKAAGEIGIRTHFPNATILRPSVVFGPEDGLFNRFARMAQLSPVLPLIGGGKTRFQPVYVGDIADAIMRVLVDPHAQGMTYELGGPRIYTMRELFALTLAVTGRKRCLVSLPFWAASLQAALLEWLPTPPLTRDQVKLLQRDNVASPGLPGLRELGIQPKPAELIIPDYLDIYRKGGRFRAIHSTLR